ncbi:MAG: type I-C CRISPR-associated protein Cas8c/Csd1 [Leptothrix sp. (in: b-proteobacteria)]
MLKELSEHGRTLGGEPGLRVREVKWCIDLAEDGSLLAVLPLGDGKRGLQLAACPDMHAMNSGGKAHFLIESAQYVALVLKPDTEAKAVEGARVRHAFYVDLLKQAAPDLPDLAVVAGVLANEATRGQLRDALQQSKAKPMDWVTWRVAGRDPRADPAVQQWWRDWRVTDLGGDTGPKKPRTQAAPARMVCLLTAEWVEPEATHSKINGLGGVGGLAMGDGLIGFDKAAFTSYGLAKSANAAMGEVAAQTYVDGLNDLVRNHSERLVNALVLHWFKQAIPIEDDPFALLMGLADDAQSAIDAQAQARQLLTAIRSGQRADLGGNAYHAITLSGASGRVMVRDWMVGSFESLVGNVNAWFDDLAMVHRDGKGLAPAPKFLAVCGALFLELKDLPAPTASTLWRVAAFDLPIPPPLMARALDRFRVDLIKDEAFNHARMGLIKAYFVRKPNGGDPHMQATVNEEHPAPAYHCGRLLAVLADLQRAALGDVGAGVVQRFYVAASQTPGLILGRLISNSRNHLNKLDPKREWWYEKQIAHIMGRLGDGAPRTLDLEGQGLFALGYYQQLAALRTSKKTAHAADTTEPIQTQGALL